MPVVTKTVSVNATQDFVETGSMYADVGIGKVISHTLIGNEIVDPSDVVGASPVGAAPTTSSFST